MISSCNKEFKLLEKKFERKINNGILDETVIDLLEILTLKNGSVGNAKKKS